MCWETVIETSPRYGHVPLVAGLLLLLTGVFVYALDRPGDSVAFLPSPLVYDSGLLGPFAGPLPSFLHAMAFSLMTASLLAPTRRMRVSACTAWLMVNWLVEAGQAPAVRQAAGFGMSGTFDPIDMLAALLGATSAFLVLEAVAIWEAS
jgi:hypothetical protein